MDGMEEVAALLLIHKEAVAVGNLNNIANAAFNELRDINAHMGATSAPPEHSLPGEPPREPPPPGASVGTITIGSVPTGGQNAA